MHCHLTQSVSTVGEDRKQQDYKLRRGYLPRPTVCNNLQQIFLVVVISCHDLYSPLRTEALLAMLGRASSCIVLLGRRKGPCSDSPVISMHLHVCFVVHPTPTTSRNCCQKMTKVKIVKLSYWNLKLLSKELLGSRGMIEPYLSTLPSCFQRFKNH